MRHQAGLSQRELAERLGWAAQSNVTHYEAGDKTPKLELIGRWAVACGFQAELRVTRGDWSTTWTIPLNEVHP